MAVPKHKVSKARRDKRRSHHAIGTGAYVEDQESGEYVRRHHVCRKTGTYRGRQVLSEDETRNS